MKFWRTVSILFFVKLLSYLPSQRMMVDEADLDPMGTVRSGSPSGAGGKRGGEPINRAAFPPKRKVGPLPLHVQARRPSTLPSPISPTSPMSPVSPAPSLSPVPPRRPTTPLAPPQTPLPTEVPSGRSPEVSWFFYWWQRKLLLSCQLKLTQEYM